VVSVTVSKMLGIVLQQRLNLWVGFKCFNVLCV